MNKYRKLIENFMIYFLGTFGSKVLIFMLLPLYTRYLSKIEYGEYDLILTLVMFFEVIVTFKLPDATYRWLIDDGKNKEEVLFIVKEILKKLTILLSVIFCIAYNIITMKNKLLIFMYLLFSMYTIFSQQIIRGLKKNKLFSILGIIESLLFLILNILFLVGIKLKVEGIILAKLFSNLIWIIFLFKELKIKTMKIKLFKNKLLIKMLTYSFPLIPSALSWWVMKVSDRLAIAYYLGVSENGTYAVANKFPTILLMLNSIFYMVWQESSITEYRSEDRDEFYSLVFNKIMMFQMSMCTILLPIIKFISENYFGENFVQSWEYVPLLLLATVFSGFSGFYATGYLSSRETIGAFKSSLLGAGLNLLINICFMKKFGLQVATISTAVSFLGMWIYRHKDTEKYFKINIMWRQFSLLLFQFTVTLYLIAKGSLKIQILILLGNILSLIFINRELILRVLKRMRGKYEKC